MTKMDWIIHIVGNGIACQECGKIENPFPQYICNAHTHGMNRYNHPDFQLVIHMSQENIGYVLNTLGQRVQSGEKFQSGDIVDGIFLDCPVRLDLLISPDGQNRFPEDPACDYPYSFQLLPTNDLEQKEGGVS